MASLPSSHITALFFLTLVLFSKRHFRFEKLWTLENGFDGMVERLWKNFKVESSTIKVMVTKLRLLRRNLKICSKYIWSNIEIRKRNIFDLIRDLNIKEEFGPLEENDRELLNNPKTELQRLCKQEEIGWKQRSRASWLKGRDMNTAHFHRLAKGRRRANYIHSISHNRNRLEEQTELNKLFTDYYKELLGFESHSDADVNWSALYPENEDLGTLEGTFVEEKIWAALKDMDDDKAPGSDGFIAFLFKIFFRASYTVTRSNL